MDFRLPRSPLKFVFFNLLTLHNAHKTQLTIMILPLQGFKSCQPTPVVICFGITYLICLNPFVTFHLLTRVRQTNSLGYNPSQVSIKIKPNSKQNMRTHVKNINYVSILFIGKAYFREQASLLIKFSRVKRKMNYLSN